MSHLTDHAAFLAAIIALPADPLPRLVYADWLDENATYDCGCDGGPLCGHPGNGYAERAEFIRVQCELAKLIGDGTRCPVCDWPLNNGACQPDSCSFRPSDRSPEHAGWFKRQRHFHALRRRERELLGRNSDLIAASIEAVIPHADRIRIVLSQPVRGFVEELTCSWSDCRAHLSAIRERTPVRKVRLTDGSNPVGVAWWLGFMRQDDGSYTNQNWPGIRFELPPRQDTLLMSQVNDPDNFEYSGGVMTLEELQRLDTMSDEE